MSLTRGCTIILVLATCFSGYLAAVCKTLCPSEMCPAPVECDDGFLKLKVTECGCCPVCIHYLGVGEVCTATHLPPDQMCKPGLICSDKTGTCVPPGYMVTSMEKPVVPCQDVNDSDVSCSFDGTYSPRQCNSTHCYCVTVTGEEIPPYQLPKSEEFNMECVCARVEYALSVATKVPQHMCDKYGNYEQKNKRKM